MPHLDCIDCDKIQEQCPDLGGGADEQVLSTTEVNGETTEITISNGNTVPILHPAHPVLDGEYDCEDEELTLTHGDDTVVIDMSCDTCCEEVTRGQLLGLRNGGNLRTECSYKIPYSRGCLVDSFIYFNPAAKDKLSHDVKVETPFDNELWEGRYSIDTNRMLELFDQRGNRVGGQVGNEVDRFPWGQASVTQNEVFNSDVYIDCDTTQVINGNEWTSNAYTDLRGFQGVFQDNSVDSYGRIYLNAATTVDFRRNKIQSFAYVYFNGGIDDIFIRQNTIADNSYVRKFATATGRFTLVDSLIARGDVRHYNGTMYMNSVDVLSSGRIYGRNVGTQDIRYTTVSDISYLNLEHQGGDVVRIWYSSFKSLSYFYIRTGVTAGLNYYYYHNQDSSTYDYRSGTAQMYVYYQKQDSNGYVRHDNTSGIQRYYQNKISSRGEIVNDGVANINMYQNSIQDYNSRFRATTTTPQLTVYYNHWNSSGQTNVTNQTGTFSYQRNSHLSYSQVNFVNTAAAVTFVYNNFDSVARANYNDCVGLLRHYGANVSSRADIDFNATTGNASVYYTTISDYNARLVANGTTRLYVYGSNINSGGRVTADGGELDVRYTQVSSYAFYTVTGGGATARLWYSNLHSISRVNSTGSYIYGVETGTNITVNTLAFNFWRTRVNGGGTVTLGANNNNRYLDNGTLGLL